MASCGCGGARERVEVMARPVYKVPLGLLYAVSAPLLVWRAFDAMGDRYTTAAAHNVALATMVLFLAGAAVLTVMYLRMRRYRKVPADRCGSCGAAEVSAKLPSGAKGWRVRG